MPFRRALLLSLLVPCFAISAQAPRALTVTRDVHIDAAAADINRVSGTAVAPWGDFLIADAHDQVVRVFGSSGPKAKIGRKGAGPGEFATVSNIGFIGDTLWTLDPDNNRISYFAGPAYKYKRAHREPFTLAPVNGVSPESELYVQAVTRSGALRASVGLDEQSKRRVSWMAGVDSGSQILVRTGTDGVFRNRTLVIARNSCIVSFAYGNSSAGVLVPFCAERIGSEDDGTADVLSANVESNSDGPWRVRVTLTGETGTTIFTQTIAMPRVLIPKAYRDSTIAERQKVWKKQKPAFQAAMPHLDIPTIYPPVRAVLLGRDGTSWIDLRTKDNAHTWYLLDTKGVMIGSVTVPANVTLRAADAGVVWGTEVDGEGAEGVVRYRFIR